MIANYHTHTWRCNHATGAEEDYVRNAIQRGLKTLGFSDHTPYCFPGSYYSNFRMTMKQLADYVAMVQELQFRFREQIRIPLGLEAEYYPRFFPELLEILRDYPMDYLILGQHYTKSEIDGVYSGYTTCEDSDLIDYCTQVMEAMQTGLFTYVAHPDLIHYQGSPKVYRQWMRRLCQESKSCHIPLELNFLGLATGRHYPNPAFLEIVAEENCPMVFGCDAHNPEALLDTQTEKRAAELMRQYGISVLEDVSLLPIR